MPHVYIDLKELISEDKTDFGLLKIILDTSDMTFKEKIKFNLQRDTWAYRLEYLEKSFKNLLNKY